MGLVRFLLALSVVLDHVGGVSGYVMIGGPAATECFFLLSGFCVALVLHERYEGPGQTKLFYRNRLLRLYGLYLPALALTLVYQAVRVSHGGDGVLAFWRDHLANMNSGVAVLAALANIGLVGQDVLYFFGFTTNGLVPVRSLVDVGVPAYHLLAVPQAWSLSLEIVFYIAAPILVRQRASVLLGLVALGILARAVGASAGLTGMPFSHQFLPFELPLFLLGALSYRLAADGVLPRLTGAAAVLPGALIVTLLLLLPLGNGGLMPAPVARIGLMSVLFLALPTLATASRDDVTDRWLGDLSYAVYLTHVLVFQIMATIVGAGRPAALACATILGSVAVAVLLHDAVGRRVDRLRRIPPRGGTLALVEHEPGEAGGRPLTSYVAVSHG